MFWAKFKVAGAGGLGPERQERGGLVGVFLCLQDLKTVLEAFLVFFFRKRVGWQRQRKHSAHSLTPPLQMPGTV